VRLSEPATSALPTVPWVGPGTAALDT